LVRVDIEANAYLTHLTLFIESSPEVDLNRRDDTESSDLEVNDNSKRDDVFVGGEMNDLVLDRNTEEREGVWVHGESGEQTESIWTMLVIVVIDT
jgi:hypothetical protein